MNAIVRLYSDKQGEISKFLNNFFETKYLNEEHCYDNKSLNHHHNQRLYVGTREHCCFRNKIAIENDLLWQKEYENPLEIADIIGSLIENQEDYKINMWISLDKDLFINITKYNADEVIRYLYERYPY